MNAKEQAIAIIEARIPMYTDIGQINALRECISSIRCCVENAVTDKMVNDAREAYRKQTGAEDYQLDGWLDEALRSALEAALA